MDINMTFKTIKKKRYKGEYVIWVEENDDGSRDVYSTDSIFWREFFR